jgi:hypothetical protein
MTTVDQESTNENVRRDGRSPWVTWVLALLTIPAAAAVLYFATGAVMSTSGCTGQSCRSPGDLAFGVMFYGAPVISVVVLAVSVVVARRRSPRRSADLRQVIARLAVVAVGSLLTGAS